MKDAATMLRSTPGTSDLDPDELLAAVA